VRHSGSGLRRLKGLPVYAVGERTAAAAREGGFRVECVGSGGLQALLDTQAGLLRLLRLAGDERVALDPPAGVTIEERVVYRARPLPLVEPAIDALGAGAVALLHSGNAARRLGEECDRLGIARASVSLAALAPAIAEAAGRGWRVVRSAQTLSDAALLAIASDMCQELGGYAAGEDRD
jgi:uroporphyrinogen-III synthase